MGGFPRSVRCAPPTAILLHSPYPHGPHPSLPACSYGAFWMSLAIYTTLSAAGVFASGADFPVKGDRLMLTLWGILVRLGWDWGWTGSGRLCVSLCSQARMQAQAPCSTHPAPCILLTLPTAPPPTRPLQTFLLWLCTFHTNLVTSWLFLSLAILFWLLAGGVTSSVNPQTERVVSCQAQSFAFGQMRVESHSSLLYFPQSCACKPSLQLPT